MCNLDPMEYGSSALVVRGLGPRSHHPEVNSGGVEYRVFFKKI